MIKLIKSESKDIYMRLNIYMAVSIDSC